MNFIGDMEENSVLEWDPATFIFKRPVNDGLPNGYRYQTPPKQRHEQLFEISPGSSTTSPNTSPDTSPDNSPFTTPERNKKNHSYQHGSPPTFNNRWKRENSLVKRRDYAKEERNKRFVSFICDKFNSPESKIHFHDFQNFDEQTQKMPTDKLLNHINQLLSNDREKDKLSKDIGDFLKKECIFTSEPELEPVFSQNTATKINVLRHIKKSECRCCSCTCVSNIIDTDIYCTSYCQIKTITIEKYMKYSQLYNLLSENGFIKTMNLTYTHKSERKKPHPFFATQCTNLHFCGFTDLTIYFV
jgi:hypothetical protein